MTEDEGDKGIPHFVADNISWWYPVDPKKISCALLQRENKSMSSAIFGSWGADAEDGANVTGILSK